MVLLGYILAVLMGLILGLIGAGGAILSLPILVYLLQVPIITATGYSLLLVGLTACLGFIGYYKKGQVDITAAIVFSLPSIIAVYSTRAWLVPELPDPIFSIANYIVSKDLFIILLFSILASFAGVALIRGIPTYAFSISKKKQQIIIGIEGGIIGILTGIIGAGGGFLIIPALVLFAGIPIKRAIGSSLLIITLKSLIGFIGDLQSGIHLDYYLLLLFFLCTTIGMFIGVKVSKYFSEKKLTTIFGIFTLTMSIVILIKETCF